MHNEGLFATSTTGLFLPPGPLVDDLPGYLFDALPPGRRSTFESTDGIPDRATHYLSDHAGRLMEGVAAAALDHTSSVVLS